MNSYFRERTTSLGTVAAALATALLFTAPSAFAQQAPTSCDRACLRQTLDTYLTAVFKHDPSVARLTDNHYATLNTAAVRNGEGFWKDVSGYGEVQRRYLDPANESAAYMGLLKQNGKDIIASVRILVEGNKISEAEWIIGQQGPGGVGQANPQGFMNYPPPDASPPASERSSRFVMISLANDYFQAVQGHDGSWVPSTDPNCIRIENGGGTTTNARPAGAAPAQAYGKLYGQGGCLENFAIFKHLTKDLALRRFPVVDEEAGVLLGSGIYVRYPNLPNQDNFVQEYFVIRNGKIAGLWSVMYFLPKGSPVSTGWENREGGSER